MDWVRSQTRLDFFLLGLIVVKVDFVSMKLRLIKDVYFMQASRDLLLYVVAL